MSDIIAKYLEDIADIQNSILTFIDNENDTEEKYQNIIQLFDNQKILDNINRTRLVLLMISKIAGNHFRTPNFFSKIEQILFYFRDVISKSIPNYTIIALFLPTQRILLFLLREKIIKFDNFIVSVLIKNDLKEYLKYFIPEIKNLLGDQEKKINEKSSTNENNDEKEDTNDSINSIYEAYKTLITDVYEEKRNIGENDNNICKIIRNDSIDEFITEYNKTGFSLKKKIESSFYETNSFLVEEKPTLIEYAAFFGSSQIFRFLMKNKVKLQNSLWLYAVHSDNPELFSILEEKCPKANSFLNCWKEAVKCYHNDVANYLQNNYLSSENTSFKFFKYYNFALIRNCNLDHNILFYYSCKYKYYELLEILLKNIKIDINYKHSKWIFVTKNLINDGETFEYEKIKRLISKKTPLNAACSQDNHEIIQLLLTNKGINVNLPNLYIKVKNIIESLTPLFIAVTKISIDSIKLLLKSTFINPNLHSKVLDEERCMSRKTPLFLACEIGYEIIVKLLLENQETDINKMSEIDIIKHNENTGNPEIKSPLYAAYENKNMNVVKILLKNKRIDVNVLNDIYKEKGFVDFERDTYDDMPFLVSKSRKTILHLAVLNNDLEMVKLLLKNKNIDVNVKYQKLIECWETSSKNEDDDIIDVDEVYSINNVDDRTQKQTALHIAIENSNYNIAKLLLSHPGIDVNALNKSKDTSKTALHMAVEKGNKKLVKLLLSHPKIDVNIEKISSRPGKYYVAMITEKKQR